MIFAVTEKGKAMNSKDMLEEIELNLVVKKCFWRKDIGGEWVCSGDLVPCLKHIYDGKCPTLIEFFSKENSEEQEYE